MLLTILISVYLIHFYIIFTTYSKSHLVKHSPVLISGISGVELLSNLEINHPSIEKNSNIISLDKSKDTLIVDASLARSRLVRDITRVVLFSCTPSIVESFQRKHIIDLTFNIIWFISWTFFAGYIGTEISIYGYMALTFSSFHIPLTFFSLNFLRKAISNTKSQLAKSTIEASDKQILDESLAAFYARQLLKTYLIV